jgi:plastocyanin
MIRSTTIAAVLIGAALALGATAVTVTLKKGTYTYQCDPHAASGMKGTFEVT